MPQAFAFIYVINTPNAGGVQEDRVSLSLLLVVFTETTEQPVFSSILEARHEIIECTSSGANRSFLFFSLFLEAVSLENLELSLEVLTHKIQTAS